MRKYFLLKTVKYLVTYSHNNMLNKLYRCAQTFKFIVDFIQDIDNCQNNFSTKCNNTLLSD